MSGRNSSSSKGEKKSPLLGARALLSRQLNSASPSPGRLPSLRPARDLTLSAPPKLGGNTKRTFTPTIPARRVKQEVKEEASPNSATRRHGEGRGRGRHEGRGRGRGERGKPNIIQASSIFSMGVSPAEKQRIGSSIPSYGSSVGGDSVASIKVKEERSEMNDEESKRVLKMLESNGDIDEVMKSETGLIPVQLPLSFLDLKAKENEAESIDLAGDIKAVKSEPADIDMVDTEEIKSEETIKKPVKRVTVKKETNQDRFLNLLSTQSEGEQKLLFLQFPDVLPIKPTTENEGDSLRPDETSDEQANGDGKQKKLSLKRASEGYIGKLQLLKSGKARLLLGEVSLDVTMGTPCGFLQDVISVHTENNRSEMICLGHVKHRLICTPDFERLLTSSPESAY